MSTNGQADAGECSLCLHEVDRHQAQDDLHPKINLSCIDCDCRLGFMVPGPSLMPPSQLKHMLDGRPDLAFPELFVEES